MNNLSRLFDFITRDFRSCKYHLTQSHIILSDSFQNKMEFEASQNHNISKYLLFYI